MQVGSKVTAIGLKMNNYFYYGSQEYKEECTIKNFAIVAYHYY